MNIGIIIHSKTGTTRRFGRLIAEKLKNCNHTVDITELKTEVPINSGSVRQKQKITVLNIPDCTNYDAVLIGGPVWAFSASPVVITCMKELSGIRGKKLLPFVTMGFPFTFMGGLQAINLMSSTASDLGATILTGQIVPKLFHNYELYMEKIASEIPSYFK